MPKVVFVNRYFHPDHSATSQMLSDLAFQLAASGQEVTVITSRLRYDDADARLPATETIDGVKVVRVATTGFGRANLAGRALDYLTFYLAAAFAMARHASAGDVLVAKTDPPMLSVLAAPMARWRRARLVNWLQDVFPEVVEAFASAPAVSAPAAGAGASSGATSGAGTAPARRWAMAPLRWLRDCSIRAADYNVVLGGRMRALVEARGVAPERIGIIANFNRGDLVSPMSRDANPLRAAWGLGEAFVVGYSGNLGRAHDIETIKVALERIASTAGEDGGEHQRPDVRFVFIGGGALMAPLERFVAEEGLSRLVQFRPYQPRADMAQSLSLADVHLISLRPEFEGLIVPSKLYGVMAAGRASIFIGDQDGEVARVLAEQDCGITVLEGDGEGLARAIHDLGRDRERVARLGRNARIAFELHFGFEHAVAKWERLIRDLKSQSR